MKNKKFSLYQSDGIWGILEDATNDGTTCVKSYFGADLIVNRMNELSDQICFLEEQLKNSITPKFKIGQQLYWCNKVINEIVEVRVIGIDILLSESREFDREVYTVQRIEDGLFFGLSADESVFATREEAEKRLAELKGDTK